MSLSVPRHLTSLVAAMAVTIGLGGFQAVREPASAAGPSAPNVLIILTDDQRPFDTMLPEIMPETLQRFGAEGTTFPNAFATTPLCCPGRAGLLTGQFAHNNGVRTNGSVENLGNHSTTLEKYLEDEGYQTALTGKFLNQWPVDDNPPHWDRWSMMDPGPDQFNTQWNIDGVVQTVTEYSTDFTAQRSVDYLAEFNTPATDDQPWFLYVNPYSPHAPYQPAPEYANAPVPAWAGNPAIFEANKSDKPPYVRKAKRDLADAVAIRDPQLRMLMSVDDMVEDIFDTLVAEDELENTIAFFLSDNGFLWSDHGLGGKNEPYLPSAQIPFYARWPGRISPGVVDTRLVANIDVAPTVFEAVGIDPTHQVDGVSLMKAETRSKMLVEAWNRGAIGGWASIVTPRYQYIETYEDDSVTIAHRQLYLLATDPWQLQNLLGDNRAKNDSDVKGLSTEVRAARNCGVTGMPTCRELLTEQVALCSGTEEIRANHVVGGLKRDLLRGSRRADLLCGFAGRDSLRAGRGNDVLLGGAGRDTMLGGKGKDRCKGGPRPDVARGCERK
jgi:arylsulfatase A-like enzyme